MSPFDAILAKHTAASGQDTKDKALGASFVVVNNDGKSSRASVASKKCV